MQKKVFLSIVAFFMCLFVGCNDEKIITEETIITIDTDGKEISQGTIIGVLPKTDIVTRTYLENQGNKNYDGENFYWSLEDRIIVIFGEYGTEDLFTAKEVVKNESSFMKFEGMIKDSLYDVTYATYPEMAAGSSPSEYTISVPLSQEQVGRTTDHLGEIMHMYAIENDINWCVNTDAVLNFKQICSIYCYRIKNNSSQSINLQGVYLEELGGRTNKHYAGGAVVSLSKEGLGSVTPKSFAKYLEVAVSGIELAVGDSCDVYQMVLPTEGINKVAMAVTCNDIDSDSVEADFENTDYSRVEKGKVYYFKLALSDEFIGLTSVKNGKSKLKLGLEGVEVVE